MGIRNLCLVVLSCFAFYATSGLADEPLPPLNCEGHDPDWHLSLQSDTAQFSFGGMLEMTIPQRTQTKNTPFPKALTLLGQRDTAIVILNERSCDTKHVTAFPIEANILTQAGEEPVILRGCCIVAD